MKLIKPSFEIWEQPPGLEGVYKQIEKAGRVCYKSEDKIAEGTAGVFAGRMTASGHGAMLEHGTVYLKFSFVESYNKPVHYLDNPYSRYKEVYLGKTSCQGDTEYYFDVYVTTNYRVLLENGWLGDLKYQCEPTEHHEKRITVKFICDRGVSHEFVRHRVMSFAQESTRYCNYSKDKFGNEITFIIPNWLNLSENSYGTIDNPLDIQFKEYDNPYEAEFVNGLLGAEFRYMNLLSNWENRTPDKRFKTGFKGNPWTPQQARAILPNALKTELVVTGFVSDWKHFFELRCPLNAHPQARELAIPLQKEFIARGYINN